MVASLVVLRLALVDPEPLAAFLVVLRLALADPEPLVAFLVVLRLALVESDEGGTFRLAVPMLAWVAPLGLAQVLE